MSCSHNSELVAHCRECVSEIVTERNRLRVERDELEAQRDAFGQKAQQLQEEARSLRERGDAMRDYANELGKRLGEVELRANEAEAQREAFRISCQQLQERVRDLESVLDAVDRWAGKRPVRRKGAAQDGASEHDRDNPQVCAGCGEPASARPLHWKVRGAWVCMECFGRERRGPCSVCGAADHTASMHAGEDYG